MDLNFVSKSYKVNRFFSILFLILSFPSFGEETSNHQQLIQNLIRTEVVYPQRKHDLQITFSPSSFNDSTGSDEIFPLNLSYGITDRWEVDLFGNSYIIHLPNLDKKTEGYGDLSFGTKYSFLYINNSNFSTSFSFFVTLPTGNINRGLTDGFQIYSPSIMLAEDLPSLHNSQIFSQAGFNFLRRIKSLPLQTTSSTGLHEDSSGDTPDNEVVAPDINTIIDSESGSSTSNPNAPLAHNFFFNFGYFFPVGNARYEIETNWISNSWNHHGKENIVYLTPGFIYEISKYVEVELGGSAGLTKYSDRYDLFAKISYDFGWS